MFLAGALNINAQGNSIPNRVIGQIQNDGTVKWKVSESELNNYLTTILNNQLGITGVITTTTILFEKSMNSWVIQGNGLYNNEIDQVRHIRVELEDVGGGNLKIAGGGITETCTGNPCEQCAFAEEGGCECKRNYGTNNGFGGTCKHTISKTVEK